MGPTPQKKNWDPPQKNIKKNLKNYGIGATIRIGREIQCLPYTGFLFIQSQRRFDNFFTLSFSEQLYISRCLLLSLYKLNKKAPEEI